MPANKAQFDGKSRAAALRAVKVLIVDDHPIFRRGLRDLIEAEPDMQVCGEAAKPSDAMRLVAATGPHVAIIDLSLEGGHGLELIEQIRQSHERVRMLVCSVHTESHFAERALRAGAMGYVNKQEAADRLMDAIRQILQGDVYLSGRMAKRVLRSVVTGESQDLVESLTNREMQVFQMIGQGLTTKQIARQLQLSPKTIDAHREKIKTKLNQPNSLQLSRLAFQWTHEHGDKNETGPISG